jgi:hypothetical protein
MTIPSAIVTMVFPFGERMAAGGGGRGRGEGGWFWGGDKEG